MLNHPPNDFQQVGNPTSKRVQFLAHCVCKVVLSASRLMVQITCNGSQVGSMRTTLDSQYRDILLVVPSSVSCSRGPGHPFSSERARIVEMASARTLHRLLGLLRRNFRLNNEIYSLRNVEESERYLVEEKMQDADEALREIIETIELWENNEDLWSRSELEQIRNIKGRVLGEGIRWWAGNPPWNDAA